ncbi:polymeric immunoglobulin receptor-like [Brienomyrus brachyistius]|uniref:polymeric immunoglobulin receptor-like n=1 Tax=Brienomyrus brachyistius TaxID=42636 RepID=UPI0020B416F0|nr:polymeric immunoglobulin receptor-like [Brienomyrus brachyistius]
MDPLMLLFLLIAGLTGAESVSSVGSVSVQRGGSVTIPCFYEDRYKTHVKYWCNGSDWSSCTPKVRSDSLQKSNEVSIRDDPEQRVFTVTMNNLTAVDSGYYCCGVEISRGPAVRTWVYLSVTEGSPGLSVDKQEVTGVEGDSVTVQCRYTDSYSQKRWCKVRRSCVSRSSGLDGRPVLIRDDKVKKVFSVTMRGLERKDTGWYWCDDDGYWQIPVHITVSLRTTTTTSTERADSVSSVGRVTVQRGGSVTIPCFYEKIYQQHLKYWCRDYYSSDSCTPIVRSDSPQTKDDVSIRDDPDQRVFTVSMNNLQTGDSNYYWCGVEISRGSAVGTWMQLSVTAGSPGLSVDKQEVTGVEGDSVTVQCRYTDSYSQKRWCKVRRSCVSRSWGLDGRPVLITDDRENNVFSVTMRGLERKDTGWYWCDTGNVQIPVHITVSLRTTTTTSTESADSVSSVGRVSVQRGGSVTIPCSYEDRYKTHVKYWCRNYYSSDSCTPIVRSDSLQKRNEVSIRDDPDQRVFNVTMNNLTDGDSGYYWCGVEISGGAAVGTWIQLSVTEGVSTVNTVSVQRGGSVTIPCYYDNMYQQHVKYWCNGSGWSSCTPIVRTDFPKISREVSIIDDPDQRVFNVTMNSLTAEDSGSYWCGVEISRGSAVGTQVYLSVRARNL